MQEESDVTIRLTNEEAMVLLEALEPATPISSSKSEAQTIAIENLVCDLEKQISNLFNDDYKEALKRASTQLIARYGKPEAGE